jgi:5-methylthioadenosine/S-adenosylhomocysteine deaminase
MRGTLSDRLNIIHGIWLDESDMDLIAAAGSVIAHNPISNLRLGSGVMPFRAAALARHPDLPGHR